MAGSVSFVHPKCPPRNPCVPLRKLVQLLEHRLSEHDTKRHLKLLAEFLDATTYGFWLRDICYIIRLFEAISRRPEFTESLKQLLRISSTPPMMVQSSEAYYYFRDLQQYFSTLSYLLVCVDDEKVKYLVVNSILTLLQRKLRVGECCVSITIRKEAAEHSQLPEVIGQLLEVASESIYVRLLEIAILLSETNKSLCRRLLEQNALEFLLLRLRPPGSSDLKYCLSADQKDDVSNLEKTCWLLFLQFDSLDGKHCLKPPSCSAMCNLHYAFRVCMLKKGMKKYRNHLVAILLKLLVVFKELALGCFENDILILSTATEVHSTQTWIKSFTFTADTQDYTFKKLILASLVYFVKHRQVKCLRDRSLTVGLLMILRKQTLNWHPPHYCRLVRITLLVLYKILPFCLDTFIAQKGFFHIVKILQDFLVCAFDMQIMKACLMCVSEALELKMRRNLCFIGENRVFEGLVSLCRDILNSEEAIGDMLQITICCGFHILDSQYQKRAMKVRPDIVDLCLSFFKRIMDVKEGDTIFNYSITVAVVQFMWDFTSTYENAVDFMKKGGLYVILDIINANPIEVQVAGLGLLVNLCRRPLCIPYLVTWRKCGKGLMQLLMEIFRGGHCPKPCVNLKHWMLKLCHEYTHGADRELLESSRWKVFGILRTLAENHFIVDIANEHYKLFNKELSTEDAVTKVLADNFLPLRLCDVWIDTMDQLEEEGQQLSPLDTERLRDTRSLIKNFQEHLRRTCEDIMDRKAQKEQIEEVKLYHLLNESTLSAALGALREWRYISKCTERMFQLRRRIRKSTEIAWFLEVQFNIKNTEINGTENSNYHRTHGDLPFSTVFNQTVNIQSNILKTDKEDTFHITPDSVVDIERFVDNYFGSTLSLDNLENLSSNY